jgi:hypothetical protein
MWEYNETVHQLFIDFEKAYDSVRREVLYNILTEFGIPMKLIRLIKMCLNETYCDVFGRMPSSLGNLKLDAPVVARQPKVKHLHGYARHSSTFCVHVSCIATNSGKVECFYWDSPIL